MRRQLTWLIAVPLAVLGTLAGHSFGYRAAVPDAHERAHLLAGSGHGYLSYAPIAVALCLALVALAFVGGMLEAFRGHRSTRTNRRIVLVAALAPLAFVVQEILERSLQQGHLHWGFLFSAPFLFGLAAQVPFALLAAAVGYALAGAAERLGRLIRASRRSRRRPHAVSPSAHSTADLRRLPVLALGFAGRGPPSRS